jgi:HD superfamily phosphohydrolase
VASPFKYPFLDPLYGEIEFEPAIADLAARPLVQRLRHIRLSNVDSLALPGIANVSRYEHALGTGALAARSTFAKRASERLRVCFIAAAITHDTAISPFGHLMEEALSYLQTAYHHESKWSVLLESGSGELGGVNLQLYLGYQSGLRDWAEKFFGVDGSAVIQAVVRGINGIGEFGPAIAGELDLDNLDNVARAAFHMGLDVDRRLPLRLAACLENVDETGTVFADESVSLVREWLDLRERVYSRFMLSVPDFSGKLMLLYSIIEALRAGVITEADWNMTDGHLVEVLLNSKQEEISTPLRRWLAADLWDVSDLLWFEGKVPSFSVLMSFAKELSSALSRPCFAYRIKDKRKRQIELRLASKEKVSIGEEPRQWLLGVGSSLKRPFTARDNRVVIDTAQQSFDVQLAYPAEHASSLFA